MKIFPALHDDELLTSGFMRLHNALGSRSIASTLRNIQLERQTAFRSPSMPLFLEHISDSLPANHPQKDLSTLARNHSVAPFILFFSDIGLEDAVRSDFRSANHFQNALGTISFQAERMRSRTPVFCRNCTVLDREKFGVALWRRNHQIPGIAVCWRCGIDLEWECSICRPMKQFSSSLAEPFVCTIPAHRRNSISAYYKGTSAELAWYGQEAVEICCRTSRFQCGLWKDTVPKALFSIGCRRGSKLSAYAIQELLRSKFTDEFLTSMRLLPERRNEDPTTLSPALKDLRRNTSPIQQLCLMLAVRDSVQSFEDDFNREKPGYKPGSSVWIPFWRDRVCASFMEGAAIEDIAEVEELPLPVVRAELVALKLLVRKKHKSANSNLAIQAILSGIDPAESAYRYKVPVFSLLSLLKRKHPKQYNKINAKYNSSRLRERRNQARTVLKENPSIGRKELWKALGHAGEWLAKNDRVWFKNFLPPAGPRPGRGRGRGSLGAVSERDAIRLIDEAARGLSASVSARQISSASLLRAASLPQSLHDKDRYPKLAAAIKRREETPTGYWIRRFKNYRREKGAKGSVEKFLRAYRPDSKYFADLCAFDLKLGY